jgi:hypothetical protein
MRYENYDQPFQKLNGKYLVAELFPAAWLNACGHKVLGIEILSMEETASQPRFAFIFADKCSFQMDFQAFADGAPTSEPIGIRGFLFSLRKLEEMARRAEELVEMT